MVPDGDLDVNFSSIMYHPGRTFLAIDSVRPSFLMMLLFFKLMLIRLVWCKREKIMIKPFLV
jgi:hypothetical protein